MNLTKYVACICEGAAEKAIMEILLDADKRFRSAHGH